MRYKKTIATWTQRLNLLTLCLGLSLSCSNPGIAQSQGKENAPQRKQLEPAKPIKKLVLPGESFLLGDRPAFVLMPEKAKRSSPQPWIMYAPTLPGIPDVHEKWMHQQFLNAGVAVAGIDSGESYGSATSRTAMSELWKEMTSKRNFAEKVCLLGRSRGGLFVSSWAIENPDKVSGLAGIYPVFDLRSYPGIARAAPAYEISADELTKSLNEHNPVARADELAKNKIPIYLIHGDVDKVVPLKDNSQALHTAYKAAGAEDLIELTVAEGQGHNFFKGFFNDQKLVDFAIQRAKSGSTENSEEGFETIFDGKTLKGWVAIPESSGLDWMVNDGVLEGKGSRETATYLSYQDNKLQDFELRFSYRFDGEGNSGVDVRARLTPAGSERRLTGYHADLGHVGIGQKILGAWDLHFTSREEFEVPRGTDLTINVSGNDSQVAIKNGLRKEDIKAGDWNDVRIMAEGNRFEFYINGKLSSVLTDNAKIGRLTEGAISFQLHDSDTQVEFKNIRLKKN